MHTVVILALDGVVAFDLSTPLEVFGRACLPGGQAQFIVHEPPIPDGATLEPVLRWMEENIQQELRLENIAAQAMMSTRTLSRRFREQTGTTPLQWLKRARLRKAQGLLETTSHSIEWIASYVGFGSSTSFRDQFKHYISISPQAYRRAFRGAATHGEGHTDSELTTTDDDSVTGALKMWTSIDHLHGEAAQIVASPGTARVKVL